jgi:thiol-disulfide isomerase/thioredoxin
MKIFFKITLGLFFIGIISAHADEHFDTLKVKNDIYTNVTIIKVSATDIYFLHANGVDNAKLKDLEPALQKHFSYNPGKAAEVAKAHAEANVQFHQQLLQAPPVVVPDTTRYPEPPEAKVPVGLEPGQKFPGFSESDVAGNPLSVAGHNGKVVLIDFWATWCGPCRQELPNVISLYQKYHGQGFDVIGVSLDEDRNALNTFTQQNGMSWQQYFDGQGWNNKLAVNYGVHSIPMTYLLNRQGVIIGKDLRGANLDTAVERALAEK